MKAKLRSLYGKVPRINRGILNARLGLNVRSTPSYPPNHTPSCETPSLVFIVVMQWCFNFICFKTPLLLSLLSKNSWNLRFFYIENRVTSSNSQCKNCRQYHPGTWSFQGNFCVDPEVLGKYFLETLTFRKLFTWILKFSQETIICIVNYVMQPQY